MNKNNYFWLYLLLPVAVNAGEYFPSRGKPVENQFIVALKPEVASHSNKIAKLNALAKANNGAVLRVYDRVLNGGTLSMSEAKAKALAKHPDVAWVEQDGLAHTTNTTQAGV